MNITKATMEDLPEVVALFDGYLSFYGKSPSKEESKNFISERISKDESTIFLARDEEGNAMGFTQVYPSFTSVGMGRTLILNDLFVHSNYRKLGVGRALIDKVHELTKEVGAIRFDLETEESNTNAQRLYESYGFVKSEGYFHYSFNI